MPPSCANSASLLNCETLNSLMSSELPPGPAPLQPSQRPEREATHCNPKRREVLTTPRHRHVVGHALGLVHSQIRGKCWMQIFTCASTPLPMPNRSFKNRDR